MKYRTLFLVIILTILISGCTATESEVKENSPHERIEQHIESSLSAFARHAGALEDYASYTQQREYTELRASTLWNLANMMMTASMNEIRWAAEVAEAYGIDILQVLREH